MECKFCGGNSFVVKDSRKREGYTYRRIMCLDCNIRYSTMEVIINPKHIDATLNAMKKLGIVEVE